MPACSGVLPGALGQAMELFQLSGVPTDQGGAATWTYAPTGGRLPFRPEDMPQARAAWAQLRCWRRRCCSCQLGRREALPAVSRAGGHGLICADALPPGVQDADSWRAQVKDVDWCKLTTQLPATHWCSYACYLGGQMCWLSAQPSGAPGSQCAPINISSIWRPTRE